MRTTHASTKCLSGNDRGTAIAAVKQRTTEMSFVSSIGPSHPISEIGTSHIYRLKKTRNEGD